MNARKSSMAEMVGEIEERFHKLYNLCAADPRVCVWVCVCLAIAIYICQAGQEQGGSECNNNNNNNGLMIVLVIGPQPGPQQQDSSYFFSIKCLRSGRGMFKDLSAHLYRGTGTQ